MPVTDFAALVVDAVKLYRPGLMHPADVIVIVSESYRVRDC